MDFTGEKGTAASLKRGKRKITEARKEQNRIAQKVYRQRQKERLSPGHKSDNTLLRKYHDLKPRQSLAIIPHAGGEVSLDAAEVDPLKQTQPVRRGHADSSLLLDLTNRSNGHSELLDAVCDINGYAGPEEELFNSDSTDLGWDIDQPHSITSGFETSVDSILMSCYYPQHELAPSRLCNSQDSENSSIDEDLYQIPGVDALVAAVSNFVNTGQFQPTVQHFPLPDLYSNHLYCIQTATLLPYLHNARCIGLSIQDLIAMKSPFYQPNTTMADDPTTLLLEARKPWIPAHLQPTLPQILFPHHPYLDLLPFPALRERAITLAAMFNTMDLKLDIFREGLACSLRSRNNEYQGHNQPWDRRSWEVKPWFWRKWRLLMDSSPAVVGKAIDGVVGLETVVSVV